MKRIKQLNVTALVVFVLIASFIVSFSVNVLAQDGAISNESPLSILARMVTTSQSVTTSQNAEVALAETVDAQIEDEAAEASQKLVANLALETRSQIASDNPATYHVVVTAYSSTVAQTDSTPFITASGSYVRDGIVAANFLPIGARVKLPDLYGEKIFVVEDRMNSRYSDRLDIWMSSQLEAKEFGRQYTRIEVL